MWSKLSRCGAQQVQRSAGAALSVALNSDIFDIGKQMWPLNLSGGTWPLKAAETKVCHERWRSHVHRVRGDAFKATLTCWSQTAHWPFKSVGKHREVTNAALEHLFSHKPARCPAAPVLSGGEQLWPQWCNVLQTALYNVYVDTQQKGGGGGADSEKTVWKEPLLHQWFPAIVAELSAEHVTTAMEWKHRLNYPTAMLWQ